VFKFFSRFATIYLMRRWMKPRWRVLTVTVVGILLINYLHSEYLVYVEVSENTEYLVLSYIAKFTLIIAILVGCNIGLRAKSFENRETHAVTNEGDSRSVHTDEDEFGLLRDNKETRVFADKGNSSSAHTSDDGFAFLRDKKQLDSRSSKILKK